MARIPFSVAIGEIQQSFRDVWSTLAPLAEATPFDWKKRRLINLADAVSKTDAVTKQQLDAVRALVTGINEEDQPTTGALSVGSGKVRRGLGLRGGRDVRDALARPEADGTWHERRELPISLDGLPAGVPLDRLGVGRRTRATGARHHRLFHRRAAAWHGLVAVQRDGRCDAVDADGRHDDLYDAGPDCEQSVHSVRGHDDGRHLRGGDDAHASSGPAEHDQRRAEHQHHERCGRNDGSAGWLWHGCGEFDPYAPDGEPYARDRHRGVCERWPFWHWRRRRVAAIPQP